MGMEQQISVNPIAQKMNKQYITDLNVGRVRTTWGLQAVAICHVHSLPKLFLPDNHTTLVRKTRLRCFFVRLFLLHHRVCFVNCE